LIKSKLPANLSPVVGGKGDDARQRYIYFSYKSAAARKKGAEARRRKPPDTATKAADDPHG